MGSLTSVSFREQPTAWLYGFLFRLQCQSRKLFTNLFRVILVSYFILSGRVVCQVTDIYHSMIYLWDVTLRRTEGLGITVESRPYVLSLSHCVWDKIKMNQTRQLQPD